MRTKAKLTLAALGFVAATTGLALWQSAPPRLEAVARRLPFAQPQMDMVDWLSSQEILIMYGDELRILSLEQNTWRTFTFRTVRHSPHSSNAIYYWLTCTVSPDGRWLLFDEVVEERQNSTRRNLCLIHPDGTGLRRFAFPDDISGIKPLWLPESQGWMVIATYLKKDWYRYKNEEKSEGRGRTFYSLDEKIPPREEPESKLHPLLEPEAIQADGRLLFREKEDLTALSLCDQNQPDHCEPLRYTLPPRGEKSKVTQVLVSRDSQTVLVSLLVEAPAIPERETWELLLKRKLTVGYEKIWVLSTQGKRPRCLVREPLTAGDNSAFFIESLSPDGKQTLVQGRRGEYYLLSL